MIIRTEAEIRQRIRVYTIALERDKQTDEYYRQLRTAINELKWILGESD